MEYESVTHVPSGLISCRIENVQAHIVRISPRGAVLRIAQAFDARAPIRFCFYRADGGTDSAVWMCEYVPIGADTYAIAVDDPAFARCVRTALRMYAEYVSCRMEDDWIGVEQQLTAAPDMGEIADAAADQYDRWYRDFARAQLDFPDKQIYVALDRPALWKLFLSDRDFWTEYAALCRIPRRALPNRKIEGIVIGSEYCAQRFPDIETFDALMRRAHAMGVRFAIATAEAAPIDRIARAGAYQEKTEVLINDWGMLNAIRDCRMPVPVLGTRLNRRRKDPRTQWRNGAADYADLLAQNAANDPRFRAMLFQSGVRRYEYESCGSPNAPVGSQNSLHLPLYHTNASRLCPMRAQIEHGNRAFQIAGACPMYCETAACLYPQRYRMMGRGNAIIAFDAAFASEAARDCYDRIVYNF